VRASSRLAAIRVFIAHFIQLQAPHRGHGQVSAASIQNGEVATASSSAPIITLCFTGNLSICSTHIVKIILTVKGPAMLDYVLNYDELVSSFVAMLIPHCRRGFGPCKTIGVIDGAGQLIAGIVYHNFDPEAGIIEISGAALPGVHWLSRRTLLHMFGYPFIDCDCQMVVQRTPADNELLLGVLARYGYDFIKVPRLFGRDRDGVLCLLTREAWEDNKFNRRYRDADARKAA
jgi:hypothetical protein